MALADLRALARRQAPTPEAVTPVTRNPPPTGYTVEAQKTEENRQSQEAVTPVTRVTRDSSNVDVEERTAPTVPAAIQGLSDAEWIAAMAEALMANPVYRITNRQAALDYFRGRALHMWDTTPDPLARGLLLGAERHRHAMAVHSRPSR